MRKINILTLLFILALFTTPLVAYAYLDPGTGSLIIQAVLAALFGAAFTVKIYWRKIKVLLSGSKKNEEESKKDDKGS